MHCLLYTSGDIVSVDCGTYMNGFCGDSAYTFCVGEVALTYGYGIGRSSSAKILDKAGVDRDLKVKDWTDDQAAKIREIIGAEYKVEGDLRSEVQLNIKRLMDIGCYRGVRHRIGLPVRGQSTKNNARTRKGRKKTVANKKKATK